MSGGPVLPAVKVAAAAAADVNGFATAAAAPIANDTHVNLAAQAAG